jgi:hypothetical protein
LRDAGGIVKDGSGIIGGGDKRVATRRGEGVLIRRSGAQGEERIGTGDQADKRHQGQKPRDLGSMFCFQVEYFVGNALLVEDL